MHFGIDYIGATRRQLGTTEVPPPDTSDCKTYVPILPSVVWPSDARNYIREVDAAYQAFAIDVSSSQVSDSFKAEWQIQLASWNKFRDDNVGIIYFGAASVMDQTDRYACILRKWRDRFIQIGGTPLSPSPLSPGQGVPPANPPDPFGWVKTMGYIALGLGVLFLGVKVVGLFPKGSFSLPSSAPGAPPPEEKPTEDPTVAPSEMTS